MTEDQISKLQNGLEQMAAMLKIFYDALLVAGFDDDHASFLTAEFLKDKFCGNND